MGGGQAYLGIFPKIFHFFYDGSPDKLEITVTRSFLKILSTNFFAYIPIRGKKDFALKKNGVIGGHFLLGFPLWGAKEGVHPLKNNSIFFVPSLGNR